MDVLVEQFTTQADGAGKPFMIPTLFPSLPTFHMSHATASLPCPPGQRRRAHLRTNSGVLRQHSHASPYHESDQVWVGDTSSGNTADRPPISTPAISCDAFQEPTMILNPSPSGPGEAPSLTETASLTPNGSSPPVESPCHDMLKTRENGETVAAWLPLPEHGPILPAEVHAALQQLQYQLQQASRLPYSVSHAEADLTMLPPTDVPSLPLLTILDFKPPALAALSFPSEPHSPALSCSPGTQMQEDMLDLTLSSPPSYPPAMIRDGVSLPVLPSRAPTSHQVSHKSRQAHDEPSGIAMHPFTMVKGNPSDPGSTAVASLPTIHSAYDAAALPMLMPDASMSRLTPPALSASLSSASLSSASLSVSFSPTLSSQWPPVGASSIPYHVSEEVSPCYSEPTVQAGSPESLGGTAPPLPKVGELSGTLPHPTVGPMPPMTDPAQEYRIQRARQRALRNRAAAQLSRDNRKRYIAELESRNARLKLENMQLRAAQEDPVRGGLATSAMAAELRRLRQQLAMMETLIAKSLQTISMHGDCPDVGLSFS